MESLVRQLASLSRLPRILPSLLLALALSVHAAPEGITIEDGKVNLLQSILFNTTWPEEEEIDRFILGLYGRDRELLRVLKMEMTNFKVREKSVVVTGYASLSAARAAHILVLTPSVNSKLAEIDRELHQSQTLIVSDGASDKRNIMVNFTHPSETRLSFEINRSNIVYAGLNLSKELHLTVGPEGFGEREVHPSDPVHGKGPGRHATTSHHKRPGTRTEVGLDRLESYRDEKSSIHSKRRQSAP